MRGLTRMKTTLNTSRLVVGLTAAAMGMALLGACSGPSSAKEADGSGSEDREESPLEEVWGDAFGGAMSDDELQAESDAKQLKVEEVIAKCMQDQGFEYTPVDWSKNGGSTVSYDAEDQESREWKEKWGYGILTGPWTEELAPTEPAEKLVDPNQEAREAMTETEGKAYDEALYGTMLGEDLDANSDGGITDDEMPPVEEQGCSGQAQAEVWGAGAEESEARKTLNEDVTALYEELKSDPDMVKANEDWSVCMTEAGIDHFTNPDEIWEYFSEKQNQMMESQAADPEATAMPEPDPALVKEEKTTALADFDCKEKVDYLDRTQKVQFAMEQEYVDSHKELVETVKAELEKQSL